MNKSIAFFACFLNNKREERCSRMKKILLMMIVVLFGFLLYSCSEEITDTADTRPVIYRIFELENPFNIALCISEDPKTSMGINFELMADQKGYVEYWEIGTDEKTRIEAEKKITDVGGETLYHYEATMTSLTPSVTYEYQVFGEDESNKSDVHQFTTESTDSPESTFMLLSDPQGSDVFDYLTYASNVLRMMEYVDKDIDFSLFTGDMINDNSSRTQWNLFMKYSTVFSTRIPMAATTGNHETGSMFDAQIKSIEFQGYLNFPENGPLYQPFDALAGDQRTVDFDQGKTYSFDYGFAHYVAINSEIFNGDSGIGGALDEENMAVFTEWLETDLSAHQDKWIIVYFHRGPYSMTYDSYNVRARLAPILEQYGVDLVLSGHDHRYSRTVIDNGARVGFNESVDYTRGSVDLIGDDTLPRNFNDYSSALGTTFLVGITSSVKCYGDTDWSGTEITYKYLEKTAVIPIITVSEDSIKVTSYIIEKSSELAVFPDSISVLEEFIIRP